MTIEQQVKMVAGFMGMEPAYSDCEITGWFAPNGKMCILGQYQPDKDFRELMLVVEKIRSLRAGDHISGITVFNIKLLLDGQWKVHLNYRMKLNNTMIKHKPIRVSKSDLIDALWTVVVQFVEFYINNNKQ